jgi:phosphoenolpyruvate carboxylase
VAISRLRWAGISPKTISPTLAHSFVSPVLTAHPTEVQRKSILDAERAIAQLAAAQSTDPAAFTNSPAALARCGARIMTLLAAIAADRTLGSPAELRPCRAK